MYVCMYGCMYVWVCVCVAVWECISVWVRMCDCLEKQEAVALLSRPCNTFSSGCLSREPAAQVRDTLGSRVRPSKGKSQLSINTTEPLSKQVPAVE